VTRRTRGAGLAAVLLAAALAGARPAAAVDSEADAAFVRGQRLEESLGDLDGALAAFRAAAGSRDPARRGTARLREASVLRRLGRTGEARAALQALLEDFEARDVPGTRESAEAALLGLGAPEPPPESPELKALREQKLADEGELLRLRRLLSDALETSAAVEPLRAALHDKENELTALRERVLDAERAARGETGELTEREREERRKADDESRRLLSVRWTGLGRDFYLAGRFEDARRFLRDAVELDPDNAVARDLLAKASAPYGEREQIVRGILEILAMEQEARAEQVRVDSAALVEEGRRLLASGDAAGALEKFDAALRGLVAKPELLDRLEPAREQAARLFDEAAKKAGSPRRAPAPPPGAAGEDPRWQEAVRAVLERAGSAGEAGGAALRIFPLGPVLRAQRAALPPSPEAGAAPRGFVLSGEVPPAGPLLQAAIRGAVEPAAWRAPGAVLEGVGATLVARAGTKTLAAVERTVASLATPPARSVLVRATAYPCDPASLVAALAKCGRTLSPLPRGTGAAAVLDPAGAAAVEQALGGSGAAPADAVFRVPEKRGFALAALRPRDGASAEEEVPGLRVRGIAWFLGDGGIAVGALVEAAVPGPAGAAEAIGTPLLSRQEAAAGGALAPGGAILVAGLPNPLAKGPEDRSHLALMLRFGDAGGAAVVAAPAGDVVLPLGDLASRNPDPPGAFGGPGGETARSTRAEAIRRWLGRRGQAGAVVRVEGTGLRVGGGGGAAGLAASDLERLRGAVDSIPVEVRAYAVDAKTEAALARGMRLESAGDAAAGAGTGGSARFLRLTGEDRKRRQFLLEGSGGRMALGAGGAVPVTPACRAPFARTEGTGARLAGLEIGVRAWPSDEPDRRTLWVDFGVKRSPDEAPTRDPEVGVLVEPGTALLFVGLPNPFSDAGLRNRVAVWVEVPGE
jgi:tetratricopeptide (TPR) repeat protein